MSNSSAFIKHVDQHFIKPFLPYLSEEFNLSYSFAEEDLIVGMCRCYADKIYDKFDFRQIKEDYKHQISKLSPNLDYVQAQKAISKTQSKLETFARINYCIDEIIHGNYEIDTLVQLYFIYSKLNKKSIKDIQSTKIYKYLNSAFITHAHFSLNKYISLSISEHSKLLQNSMVKLDFATDHYLYQATLTNDGKLITDKYQFDLTPEEISNYLFMHDEPSEQAIFVAEKEFQQRLIEEMRTQENGMIF